MTRSSRQSRLARLVTLAFLPNIPGTDAPTLLIPLIYIRNGQLDNISTNFVTLNRRKSTPQMKYALHYLHAGQCG